MTTYLSIIIPVYNERENIAPLAAEIDTVLAAMDRSAEVLWVDDGSSDGSFAEIEKLAKTGPVHKGIALGRNYGQTAAISAGISACRGSFIALLDADMQNDPADIPAMLEKTTQGFDVVSGWRKNRRDTWATRTLPSRIANWLISRVTGVALHDYGCTLKIYRRTYLTSFKIYGEMHRFLPAFAGGLGARITEMPVNHRPRTRGTSKYGLMRTFKVILDLITVKFMGQYLSKPIYVFGGAGIALGTASVFFAAVTLYKKFFQGVYVKDQPLFMVAIFLGLVGVQMLLLGILSEVLIRVYYEINRHPPYFIKGSTGFDNGSNNNEQPGN